MSPAETTPARPHHKLTPDGRRLREVLTYSRRGSRFTFRQQAAWDAHAGSWWIPDERVDEPGFSVLACFDRVAPLVVEIGCGVGEATAALAAAGPEHNVLAFEVWRPGVAETLGRLADVGAGNVRVMGVDAVWSVEHLLGPGDVHELWTFFPDPWPKKRHHKRRLVTPAFASLVASRLEVGGVWRLATDWPDYARQMQQVLDAEPALVGGVVPRWGDRPLTRFERRGLAAGRPVTDLCYCRRRASSSST
ncbi:MAG TPA: tRNA (guanosine(46)-N7)-methyltransferase TrmB [Marmoricola sp.]|nr:tRNA (guanosine(46)-N7)-methyltransferase TrmB [Marmoricola sp.]